MTIIVKAARTKVDIKYDLYFQPVMTGGHGYFGFHCLFIFSSSFIWEPCARNTYRFETMHRIHILNAFTRSHLEEPVKSGPFEGIRSDALLQFEKRGKKRKSVASQVWPSFWSRLRGSAACEPLVFLWRGTLLNDTLYSFHCSFAESDILQRSPFKVVLSTAVWLSRYPSVFPIINDGLMGFSFPVLC